MLQWWRGIYDHVFMALHPFCRGPSNWMPDYSRAGELKQAEPVRWAEIARSVGSPAFEAFALATCFPCCGWSIGSYVRGKNPDPDEGLIRRLRGHVEREDSGLVYPWVHSISPTIEAQLASAYTRLGARELTAWSEFKDDSVAISPEVLGSPSAEWRDLLEASCDLRDDDCQMLVCSEWEAVWSAIALTDRARAIVRPETVFEGFYAGPKTPWDWVFRPNTYAYPDWLREAPHAA